MSGNGYRLLGYVVWQGGKWYLRRRLPSARKLALVGLVACGAATVVVLIAKRASG